jgi:murein DD-endopeptidase MepM/ murein hydrolase activator NlpD
MKQHSFINSSLRVSFAFVFTFAFIFIMTGCTTTPINPRRAQERELRERPQDKIVNSTASELPFAKKKSGDQSLAKIKRELAGNVRGQGGPWSWPIQRPVVTSSFGYRPRDFHEGVDFAAKEGTPIVAVQKGKVIYADSKISGYGKMIVLKHDNKLSSIYAHNSKMLVRKGQWVKRGQMISYSGKTGRVSGPHLHFEIRQGTVALDPLKILGPTSEPIRSNRALAQNQTQHQERSSPVKKTTLRKNRGDLAIMKLALKLPRSSDRIAVND